MWHYLFLAVSETAVPRYGYSWGHVNIHTNRRHSVVFYLPSTGCILLLYVMSSRRRAQEPVVGGLRVHSGASARNELLDSGLLPVDLYAVARVDCRPR